MLRTKTLQQENPDWDIWIYDRSETPRPCVGNLDSGTSRGLWVSLRKVKELGLASRIDYSNPGPDMESVSGHLVNSDASIWLTWRPANGTRTFRFRFHVIDANSYDVIFSMEFLRQNG